MYLLTKQMIIIKSKIANNWGEGPGAGEWGQLRILKYIKM